MKMSADQKFLVCSTAEEAEALDAAICAHLQLVDGSKGSRWGGAQIRDDGTYGIVWEAQLEKIWPELAAKFPPAARLGTKADALPLTVEVRDPATLKSNWQEKPAPVVKADAAPADAASADAAATPVN